MTHQARTGTPTDIAAMRGELTAVLLVFSFFLQLSYSVNGFQK